MSDHFEVFGLPRKLEVDLEALQRRFYELSRRHHPDFHRMESEAEQGVALERSALVNRAYRALRDPLSRVEYLIAIEDGHDGGEGAAVKPQPPMDLLEEMLEIQEALEEAKTSGLDAPTSAQLGRERERLLARQSAGDAALVARFADWDRLIDTGGDRASLLAFFKQALAARAYLRTVIDDLGEALGQDQDTHVSHRRH